MGVEAGEQGAGGEQVGQQIHPLMPGTGAVLRLHHFEGVALGLLVLVLLLGHGVSPLGVASGRLV
uniref:Uncharacterized protein n=1 Tax=uncultured Oceanospirillales bacterium HF0500_09M11 TaxID=723621 RepID=E7C531_9GAMM|nr:hypothetical protein [uncultured Oceanospirillales bacterium HF0500_09M11]